ncbi:MAG: nuclear transport factor 2 family protein [Sphingomonadaceae bacterium]|nr:nuclear transport factor 2 family protein [Sphingobium sp.]MBP9157934.1 nuclear transport factor 2 family protein [Sphingobium sp.]MCC6481255.1 nuclear transport factor 2 family protein [Sphingomonadaceae bacterium]
MLRTALGDRVNQGGSSFMDLVADDIIMDFPFALPGQVTQLNGAKDIAQHLEALSSLITLDRMSDPIVHVTSDPDVVIVEVDGFGVGLPTGEAYEQSYVCVITTRNKRIVYYKDYWNPIVFLRALQGSATIDALIGGSSDAH